MIFLTGHHATGKTVAAHMFTERGYRMIDTGPIMRGLYARQGAGKPFRDWISDGEAEHGPDFTNAILVAAINPLLADAFAASCEVVIVGNRSLAGLRYIKAHATDPVRRSAIVYIEAPFELLHQRWMERESCEITRAAFSRLLQRDRDMGVEDIKPAADFVIVNDSSFAAFRAKMETLCVHLANGRSNHEYMKESR